MKQLIFGLCLSFFCWMGCTDDSSKKVQEVRAEGKISEIIRNPVTAEGVEDTINVAKIQFDEISYDFGTVEEGEIVTKSFSFTNVGKVPLIISGAKSSCGCTVPTWPKDAIEPGGTGEIEVKFNTEGKERQQNKPVMVIANTYPSETRVYLEGYVNPNPEESSESD